MLYTRRQSLVFSVGQNSGNPGFQQTLDIYVHSTSQAFSKYSSSNPSSSQVPSETGKTPTDH